MIGLDIESLYGHHLPMAAGNKIGERPQYRLIEFSAFADAAPRLSASLDRYRRQSSKRPLLSLMFFRPQQQDAAVLHADRLVRKQIRGF